MTIRAASRRGVARSRTARSGVCRPSAGRRAAHAPPGCRSSAWPPTEPAPNSFQHGCAPTSRDRPVDARPARRCRGGDGACPGDARRAGCAGQPQNGNPPPETRRLSAAATSKRLLRLRSSSVDQPGDLVPHRAPRRPAEPESRGKTGRVAERKIEAEQYPLVAAYGALASHSASSALAAWRVGGLTRVSPPPACRPQMHRSRCCRGPAAGSVRRAPVDDDVVSKSAGIPLSLRPRWGCEMIDA